MNDETRVFTSGLLFDMDGVLISSIASVVRCWQRWAAHYGVPDAATVQVPHGVRAVDIMQILKPGVDSDEGLKLIEEMELNDLADMEVLPGARDLLESLPKERWAIVTSATRRLMLGRLQAARLPVPDRIIAGDEVIHGKPHPEPYMRGAALIEVTAQDAVVVEDAPTGVGAGKAAGCRVLAVLGTHGEQELRAAGADWVVASLENVSARLTDGQLELRFREASA